VAEVGRQIELGVQEYSCNSFIVLTRYIESGMAQKPPYEETVVDAETYDGRKIRAIAFTAAAHTCASYEVGGYCYISVS